MIFILGMVLSSRWRNVAIMLLLLLNYVVVRALWKIDVHLISTLVNKSLYYYYLCSLNNVFCKYYHYISLFKRLHSCHTTSNQVRRQLHDVYGCICFQFSRRSHRMFENARYIFVLHTCVTNHSQQNTFDSNRFVN